MESAKYKEYSSLVFKGVLTGVLSAYLLIYGLRPSIHYPEIILDFFENKWIILVLLILNYYIFLYDYKIGCMFLLCIIALILDYIIFVNNDINKTEIIKKEGFDNDNDNMYIFNDINRDNIDSLQLNNLKTQ
jgi:hypothetical protein